MQRFGIKKTEHRARNTLTNMSRANFTEKEHIDRVMQRPNHEMKHSLHVHSSFGTMYCSLVWVHNQRLLEGTY